MADSSPYRPPAGSYEELRAIALKDVHAHPPQLTPALQAVGELANLIGRAEVILKEVLAEDSPDRDWWKERARDWLREVRAGG